MYKILRRKIKEKLYLRDILTATKTSIADFDNLIAVGDSEINGKTVNAKAGGGFKTPTFKNASSAVSIDIILKTKNRVLVSVGYERTDGTLGMGFYGMCASSPEDDYVYHVSQAIKAENPDVEITKIHGAPFEQLENADDFDKLWNVCHPYTKKPMKELFTQDLDLIIIQLGENTNTPERDLVLQKTIDKFISGIKECSPKARIIWVHGFFNEDISGKTIIDACNRWRIGQICLKDLYTRENCAEITQEYLKADGTKAIVEEGWIEHPGNLGMKRIAQRIVDFLKL